MRQPYFLRKTRDIEYNTVYKNSQLNFNKIYSILLIDMRFQVLVTPVNYKYFFLLKISRLPSDTQITKPVPPRNEVLSALPFKSLFRNYTTL